ncbi:DUF5674 family protein [Trichothermofontia sp.]
MDIVLIIASPATPEQMAVMLSVHRFYMKLAININRGILAGESDLHADCLESVNTRGFLRIKSLKLINSFRMSSQSSTSSLLNRQHSLQDVVVRIDLHPKSAPR